MKSSCIEFSNAERLLYSNAKLILEKLSGSTCGQENVNLTKGFAKKFKKKLSEVNLINCNPTL